MIQRNKIETSWQIANQKDLGDYYIGTPGTQNRETTTEGSSINSSK